jgi:hypothetical protein
MPKRSFFERPLGYSRLPTSRFINTPHFAVELQEKILQYCNWQERFRLYMAGVLNPGGPTYNIISLERNRQLKEVVKGLKLEANSYQSEKRNCQDSSKVRRLDQILKRYDRKIKAAERLIGN